MGVTRIVALLLLASGVGFVQADVRELRMQTTGTDVYMDVSGDDTDENRQKALAAYFEKQYPDFDPADPVCRDFLWFAARWCPREPDGRNRFIGKYHAIGVEQFNACQKACQTLSRRDVPQAYKDAWRKRWAREFQAMRLPLSLRVESARTDVPAGGAMVAPGTGAAFAAAVAEAYPSFKALDAADQVRWMNVLAHINAGLDEDGYCVTRGTIDESAPHVVVRFDDGTTRLYRYAFGYGTPIYLPPAAWLAGRASERALPGPEKPAERWTTGIYKRVLPEVVRGRKRRCICTSCCAEGASRTAGPRHLPWTISHAGSWSLCAPMRSSSRRNFRR